MSAVRRALVALALSGAASSAGCTRTEQARPENRPEPPAPADAARATPQAAVALDPQTRGWELGKRYAYDMKLTTVVTFDGGRNNFDFDVIGTLEVEPASVVAESATLFLSLFDVRIESRSPGAQAELDKLAAEFRASGAFFSLSGGRTADFFSPPDMSQMATGTYRHIAAALQFARPTNAVKSYTAEEYDTTGQYVAEYSLGTGGAWHKKKLRYLGVLGSGTALAAVDTRIVPEVTYSLGEIRLSADGRPTSVKLADQMEVKGARMRSALAISLESLPKRLAPKARQDLQALFGRMRRLGANEAIPDPSVVEALDEAKIGGLDFETIVARLEKQPATKEPSGAEPNGSEDPSAEKANGERQIHQDGRLFHALDAILRTQPGSTDKAIQKIRSKSAASHTLMAALGSAATPEAHRALGKLLADEKLDHNLETRIILCLARSPRPTTEAIAAFQAVLKRDPVNAGALYGLGSYSRSFRDQGKTQEAAKLGEFLLSRLAFARGDMSLVVTLRAIANSGYAAALARVLPYLDDKRERIRAAALRSLQSMPDARVDGIIATRLGADSSPKVRLSAIEAAKLRDPGPELVAALGEVSAEAEDPHVRFRAVELMASWLPKRPELRSVLERVAKNDGEARIRERAQSAL